MIDLKKRLAAIAAHTDTILAEYKEVPAELCVPWVESHLYGTGWGVVPLVADNAVSLWKEYPALLDALSKTRQFAPQTIALLKAAGASMAGFSVIQPGTRIKAHRGYIVNVTRAHLGLIIPSGDCKIRVAGKTRKWHKGKWLTFPDYEVHGVWNNTPEVRVVLLADFDTP